MFQLIKPFIILLIIIVVFVAFFLITFNQIISASSIGPYILLLALCGVFISLFGMLYVIIKISNTNSEERIIIDNWTSLKKANKLREEKGGEENAD